MANLYIVMSITHKQNTNVGHLVPEHRYQEYKSLYQQQVKNKERAQIFVTFKKRSSRDVSLTQALWIGSYIIKYIAVYQPSMTFSKPQLSKALRNVLASVLTYCALYSVLGVLCFFLHFWHEENKITIAKPTLKIKERISTLVNLFRSFEQAI